MSEPNDLLSKKKRTGSIGWGVSKPLLDAIQDMLQMRFGHPVKHPATVLLTMQQTTALHQTQVLGSHGAGQMTRLGQLADSEICLQQHLNHSQSMRMSQRTQALSRLPQGLQVGESQVRFAKCWRVCHDLLPLSLVKYIGTFRHVKAIFLEIFPKSFAGQH
jgi:hypothetical protein